MVGRIMTLVGYKKAPKATFMLKHPVKGVAAMAVAKPRATALGLSAVAAAVPLGVWWMRSR